MKKYEIWIGKHDLGQEYGKSIIPELVAVIDSIDFKTACIKYELLLKYNRIIEGEKKNDLNSQDYHWWFNENKISNSWIGKYYETEQEALDSFK